MVAAGVSARSVAFEPIDETREWLVRNIARDGFEKLIEVREEAVSGAPGEGYGKAMHHGKLALCYLRKLNRDKITTRSMELTAMARPMLAEKTDEHDAHFIDGVEYAGFRSDADLVAAAARLLRDEPARLALAQRGRLRCLDSGYSTIDRAREMLAAMRMP